MFLRLSELQSRSSSAPQWGACRLIRPHIVFIRVFPQGCGSAGRCLNGRPPLAIRPHFHPGVRLPVWNFSAPIRLENWPGFFTV